MTISDASVVANCANNNIGIHAATAALSIENSYISAYGAGKNRGLSVSSSIVSVNQLKIRVEGSLAAVGVWTTQSDIQLDSSLVDVIGAPTLIGLQSLTGSSKTVQIRDSTISAIAPSMGPGKVKSIITVPGSATMRIADTVLEGELSAAGAICSFVFLDNGTELDNNCVPT